MERLSVLQALEFFYKENNIDKSQISDRYCPGKSIDHRLYQLDEKASEWLKDYCKIEQEWLAQLLAHYQYLTEDKMLEIWQNIFDNIQNILSESDISWNEVLFVTTESIKGVKCGAASVQENFGKVSLCVIQKDQIITSIEKQSLDKLNGIKIVVFLDDVVATGITIKNTINLFLKHFSLDDDVGIQFYWASAVYHKRGIRFINRIKIQHPWIKVTQINGLELKSAFHRCPEAREFEKGLVDIETRVDNSNREEKCYIMGFEKCKLLISTYYDTPNNTMCVFWKVTNINKTPFRRMNQKCTLFACQQAKKDINNFAYSAKVIREKLNER